MSKLSRLRPLAFGGAISVALAGAVPVRSADLSPEELLRRSDVGALAPESTLVRLLGPKERGKYLLRLGRALWFLAPGAKKPVRLNPSYRLRGSATLDDVLGLQYARDYRVRTAAPEEDGLVTLELAARAPGAVYPEVRYVVRRASLRPVRAEYRLASGKVATIVEFAEWGEGRRPYVRRLLIRDALRGGAATQVEVLEMEERAVPDGLFDLSDPSARQRLETAPAAP
jgi:hypothetical protein